MCPDLVLKRSPILPPFLCFPSFRVPFSLFFSASPTCSLIGVDFQHPTRCLGGQTRRTAADNTRLTSTQPPPRSHSEAELYAPAHRSGRRSRTGGYLYFANRPLSCQTIVAWSPQSGMAQTPGCFPSWSAGTAEGSRRRGGEVPEVRTDKTAETFHCRQCVRARVREIRK